MALSYDEKQGKAFALSADGQWAETKIARDPNSGKRWGLDGDQWRELPSTSPSLASQVGDMFTGASRTEFPDARELGTSGPQVPAFSKAGLKMMGAYATSPNEKGISDIAQKVLPGGALPKQDKFGNEMLNYSGQDYYINKPGLSEADMFKLTSDIGGFAPAARLGGMLKGLFPRAGAIGALSGTTSLGQDLAAQQLGSEQPADMTRAKIAGLTGGLAEIASPAVSAVYRFVVGRPELYANGSLTRAGVDALKRAGLDASQITDDFARKFAVMARDAADPAQAARAAEGMSLPVPLKFTRGQITEKPSDQMFESLAAKGAYGQQAESVMQGKLATQAQALDDNASAIQMKLGGGQVAQRGQSGMMAQDKLAAMRIAEKTAVDSAYETARSTTATMSPDGIKGLAYKSFTAVSQDHNLAGLPRTTQLLKEVDDFANTGQPTSIAQMFDWRKRIVNAQKAGGEEAVALGKVKTSFDRQMDEAIDAALVNGDDAAIQAFKDAIAKNREFAGRFKGGDIIQRLVSKEPRSGEMQLIVPPDKAANAIFGSATLFGGQNTARDLARLKEMLGPNSPEWAALREEGWLRLAEAGKGARLPNGEAAFSGAKFSKAFDNAMLGQNQVMKTLYSGEELALLNQFKNAASRSTIKVGGGDNPSGTTIAASNIMQRLMQGGLLGEGAASRLMMIPVVKAIYGPSMGLSTVGRTTGEAAKRGVPPGMVGGAGAVAGSEIYSNQ